MQNMIAKAEPRSSDRRVVLSFKLLKDGKSPDTSISYDNTKGESETVISIDIHNAMRLIGQMEDAISRIMADVDVQLDRLKSTPSLAEEDPTHRKKV